jgi:hypothetical protein
MWEGEGDQRAQTDPGDCRTQKKTDKSETAACNRTRRTQEQFKGMSSVRIRSR